MLSVNEDHMQERPWAKFDVHCDKHKPEYVHWTIRMPLIMIKKACEEEREEAPSSTLYSMILPLYVLPCSLALPPPQTTQPPSGCTLSEVSPHQLAFATSCAFTLSVQITC